MWLGIVGKKQVGKSTVTKYLVNKHRYHEYSFADSLKEMLIRNGLLTREDVYTDGDKSSYARLMLQTIGNIFRKEVSADYWINKVVEKINDDYRNELISDDEVDREYDIVLSDVRHINEANFIKKNSGILIRVIRENNNNALTSFDLHESETEQNSINVDYTIYNDRGIEELEMSILRILNSNTKK